MNKDSFFIRDEYKAPLSLLIQKEYNKLIDAVSQLPDSHTTEIIDATGGRVSVSDLIAYQIGWGNLLVDWYTAGVKGQMPIMPGEGFTSWDYIGLSKHFYKKYKNESTSKQIQKFRLLVLEILGIVEKEHRLGNLDQLGVWPWCTLKSGKQWPLSKWITVNTLSPYKKASALVRKHLKIKKL